ncbi:MAG TPA: S8 family serine peptidase, partial [Micromonosporaceae bacterium]|nr:S8 family serine peptidase [Micromonosporaceae bacterium]
MKSISLVAALMAAVVYGGGVPASAVPAPSSEATAGLVVGLRAGTDADLPADRVAAAGVDVVESGRIGGLPAVTLDVPSGDATEAVAALRDDPAVRYVEPVRRRGAFAPAVTADDPLRSEQWGLDRATVPGAWQHTRGSAATVVAVLDTGVNEVADLAGAVLPGRDYIRGATGSAVDDNGHGTSVAAVLAGRGDDATGIAGACWSCKILPVKVLDGDGFGDDGTIAAGIYYAVDAGADVINLSLGGPGESLVLADAVAHAIAHGVLVVAAAGNDGGSVPNYPAGVPGVLAVGASGPADTRYSWSSHGASWVDV